MAADPPIVVRIVINALGEGGTERSMAELTPLLRERDVELRYAILRSRGQEGVEPSLRSAGVVIDVLPPGRARLAALRRLARDDRADVVHSMLFDADLTARLAHPGLRAPLMTSIVNTTYSPARRAIAPGPAWKRGAVQLVDAVSGRLFVDHYHAVSEAARGNALEQLLVRPARITVVPRGRHDPRPTLEEGVRTRVRGELGIPVQSRVVVAVGRQERQKDLPTLVRAMRRHLQESPETWLLLVGRKGAASAEVAAALDALPDPSRVLELGHRGDVPAVLAASDVFAMTSLTEGLPGAVIEAMAVGLPVVASDIAPVHEVVEPGRSALLAPPGQPEAFATQLGRLLDDRHIAQHLATRGRAIFEQRFRIEACADAMADLYRRVAAMRRR